MQTSGTCPSLSDGSRKTITTKAPKPAKIPAPKFAPMKKGGRGK